MGNGLPYAVLNSWETYSQSVPWYTAMEASTNAFNFNLSFYGHAYWFPFVLLKRLKSNSYFLFKITCVVLLFSSLFILQTDVIGDIQGVSQNQQNNGLWEVDVNSIGSENCCNWQWLAWEQLTSIVFGRIRFGLDTSGQEVVGGKNIWAGKKLSHISSLWSNIIWPSKISVKYARSNLFLVQYNLTK